MNKSEKEERDGNKIYRARWERKNKRICLRKMTDKKKCKYFDN